MSRKTGITKTHEDYPLPCIAGTELWLLALRCISLACTVFISVDAILSDFLIMLALGQLLAWVPFLTLGLGSKVLVFVKRIESLLRKVVLEWYLNFAFMLIG